MKHVQKGAEPLEFSYWKALANDDWQPTYDDLSGQTKKTVKDTLMKEQGYLCCYCECQIDDDDSHIEHFRPQSHADVDPLDFSNFLCSCQNQLQKGVPRHCGNLKGSWYDSTLLVSPFDSGCEERFIFTGLGFIEPKQQEDRGANETIKRLGLDLPKLNSMRASVIEPFLDDTLSTAELQRFVMGYLQKDSDGRFGEFWSAIRYLFGDVVTV
jgi:uncharacterized protein (TIGR02646 family)